MSRYVVSRKKPKATPKRALRRREVFDGKPCPYCGVPMVVAKLAGDRRHPRFPTHDHVFPASLGGTAKLIVCDTCNVKKGNMTPSEWLAHVVEHMPDRAEAIRAIFRKFHLNWTEPLEQGMDGVLRTISR